jgi:8-amino-7-oxononanoate synthase
VLDFTSAAYLGIKHSSTSLNPWSRIALSKPAAIAEPPGASAAAMTLATLQNCQSSSLATSTLHLLWDIGGLLPATRTQLFIDSGAYAVGRWGAERARARGIITQRFRHFDTASLENALKEKLQPGFVPTVLADGFCPACGRVAPLPEYLCAMTGFGGSLIVDDTQALGILGTRRLYDSGPYGKGGGGSLCWHNVGARARKNVLLVSSLAKAFNVPLAALSGDMGAIRAFEAASRTRVHCSPPAVAAICAMSHALSVNEKTGDRRRLHLSGLVDRFQTRMASIGLNPIGNFFPVQAIAVPEGWTSLGFVAALRRHGIHTVATRSSEMPKTRVSFVLSAAHAQSDVDELVHAVGRLLKSGWATRHRRHYSLASSQAHHQQTSNEPQSRRHATTLGASAARDR